MTVLRERYDLEPLEPLPAVFVNAEQEFIGAATVNFAARIKPGSTTVLQVPAGAGNARAAIGIQGRWRWVEANVERASIGGAARTLDLYVTAEESNYVAGDPGETDLTNRAFDLALVEENALPAGAALKRLVAKARWDGSKFTAVDAIVGGVVDTSTRPPSAHAASHLSGGADALLADVATRSVLDVGVPGQTRAGRQLALADFTTLLGLPAPVGLFNLGNNAGNDSSGNGRDLAGRSSGTAPIVGVGVTATAGEATRFNGTDAAFYRADAGTNDPFRLKTGSWGCWFRTAKRGTVQALVSKHNGTSRGWMLAVNASNQVEATVNLSGSAGGTTTVLAGSTDVCDDRWHHAVLTFDGSVLRIVLDGAIEATVAAAGTTYTSTAPLNVGAYGADGSTAATTPHFGAIDEAFVTANVLSVDQARLLYAAAVPHVLGATPGDARVRVRRRRRGAPLIAGDFPTQPLRLYNFSYGADGGPVAAAPDLGSQNINLTQTGGVAAVAGPDGAPGGAAHFDGTTSQYMTATGDVVLGTTRSYGAWMKTIHTGVNRSVLSFGGGSAGTSILLATDGTINDNDGLVSPAPINDGAWHFVVMVDDSAASDGLKKKLYIDGSLVHSLTATPFTATSGDLRVGGAGPGVQALIGDVDGVFACGYALTAAQIAALYAKGSSALPPSPKNAGDHVEAVDGSNLYVVCDSLEPQHQVDFRVAA